MLTCTTMSTCHKALAPDTEASVGIVGIFTNPTTTMLLIALYQIGYLFKCLFGRPPNHERMPVRQS
jgi:hypothetical protein